MSSGVNKVIVGSFYGSGATKEVRTVGFRPKLVRLVNVASGGLVRFEWFQGMADDTAIKTAAIGDISVLTSLGITPLSDGFQVGADTDMNVDGELIRFEAVE
jgi:hypothetical protein